MLPAEGFKVVLREAIVPPLKAAGFARRGQTFYRRPADGWEVFNVQRSRFNTAATVLFTLNLGVASARLLRFFAPGRFAVAEPKTRPEIWDCHWQQRLGFLLPARLDTWWAIEAETPLAPLIREIGAHLRDLAIPEIARHASDEALRDLWLGGRSPGLTDFQRLLNLTVLLEALGPRERLAPVMDELRRISAGKPFAGLAEEQLRKLRQEPPS